MIAKKRIRNVIPYLSFLEQNQVFRVVCRQPEEGKVISTGFAKPFSNGQMLLPKIGKSLSRFNSIGGFKVHRDQPKETMFREKELVDWHGNTHFVDVPYQRYPRTPIAPPSVELELIQNEQGLLIVSAELINSPENYQEIKHVINLFLEIFGPCELFNQSLVPALSTNIQKLNWEVLPKGKYPWSALEQYIQGKINSLSEGVKHVVENRFKLISSFTPEFVAQGRAGFYGYFIFGFQTKGIYILESTFHGNATYILGSDWEDIARLTKKEILDDSLHQARFVHGKNWARDIKKLLMSE